MATLPTPQRAAGGVHWRRLPDFIIGGAMKCGTTSLHRILASQPDVFMPECEIAFFDIDDVQQHPDFFVDDRGAWRDRDFDGQFDEYFDWYAGLFAPAADGQLIGEDSTTYLASSKAPARIARMLPDARLIFMLRDPASRAYSHYWHQVRAGRAVHGFEETLLFAPGNIIVRGLYRQQIERYLALFPRENLHFVLFEEFIAHTARSVAQVRAFLGLPPEIDLASTPTLHNPGYVPRSPRLSLWKNRLLQRSVLSMYARHGGRLARRKPGRWTRAVQRVFEAVNPSRPGKPPPMHPRTRAFLNDLFARENEGLSDLIGQATERHWYKP